MLWVALGHFYMYGVFYGLFDTEPLRNRGDAEKVNLLRIMIQKDGHFILIGLGIHLNGFINSSFLQIAVGQVGNYNIIWNALPSVDTFFLMGSILVSYLTLQQLEKKRFNLVLFYVHRYIR